MVQNAIYATRERVLDTVRRLLRSVGELNNALPILLISHDPMVISIAHRIHQLKDGILVEHQELLQAT